jgi:hypothetical protein
MVKGTDKKIQRGFVKYPNPGNGSDTPKYDTLTATVAADGVWRWKELDPGHCRYPQEDPRPRNKKIYTIVF